jgi:hypothetical protein
MGSRRQSREATLLTVNLCGTDSKGQAFIERVQTANISRDGALLEGVRNHLALGEMVVVRCEGNTGRFRVVWQQGEGRRLGLSRITSATRPEDSELTATGPDDFLRPRTRIRRQHPRHKFEVAAEIRLLNAPTPMWVTSRNLSEEGCSVQTTAAVPRGIELNVAFWLGEERVWAQGVVVDSLYGFGTGIRFTTMSRQDRQLLQDFLAQKKSEISDRRQAETRKQGVSPEKAFGSRHSAGRGQSEPAEFTVTMPLMVPEGHTIF